LSIDGVIQEPVERENIEHGIALARFQPPEKAEPAVVRAEFTILPGDSPKRMDLYEEPAPRCSSTADARPLD